MGKTLVAYFSASGVTERVAKTLAAAVEADLYEIRPAVPYTSADLNWMDKNSRSTIEMKDKTSRPELADTDADIAAYDRIFVGFPIWWYTAPTIINTFLESYDFSGKTIILFANTFLESYDFSGKTIILFATSGGSGLGKTAKDLEGSCPGAVIREGKLLNGNPSTEALKKWAEQF